MTFGLPSAKCHKNPQIKRRWKPR